jgi:hypothetical protein
MCNLLGARSRYRRRVSTSRSRAPAEEGKLLGPGDYERVVSENEDTDGEPERVSDHDHDQDIDLFLSDVVDLDAPLVDKSRSRSRVAAAAVVVNTPGGGNGEENGQSVPSGTMLFMIVEFVLLRY